MNGELHHASRLTAAVRYALAGDPLSYERFPYEQEPKFLFHDTSMVTSGGTWMEKLRADGLRDVLILSPLRRKGSQSISLCGRRTVRHRLLL